MEEDAEKVATICTKSIVFAELLLELRLHILPDQQLDAVGNVGRASYDIRGISELCAFLAERQSSVDLVVEPDRTCKADVIRQRS